MDSSFSTRGLKALFSYPFRQAGWGRSYLILLGLILAGFFIPVIPLLFAAGYMAEIMRRAAAGEGEPELPEWDQWTELLVDGLRLAGVSLIASIPLLIVGVCGFGPYFLSVFGAPFLSSGRSDAAGLLAILSMGGFFWFMFSIACSIALAFLVGIPLPAAVVHVASKRSLAALFRPKEWWKIFRANLGGFVIVFFLLWAFVFGIQLVTQLLVSSIIFCLGAFIAPALISPYIAIILSLMFGKAYQEGVETLALLGPSDPREPDGSAERPAES